MSDFTIGFTLAAIDKVSDVMDKVSGKVNSAINSIATTAEHMAVITAEAFGAAAIAAGTFLVASTLTAARVEELAVVNQVLAKNAGLSSQSVTDAAAAVKSMGIESAVSQEVVAKFIQNQLDLSKASDLARVAQDAAVISGENSTDALNAMIAGIVELQPRMLRTHGIIVDSSSAYDTYAESIGVATKDLTEQQKQQALLNAVLEAGTHIAGAYEAAMTTGSKQIRSWPRLLDDIKDAVGAPFVDAFDKATSIVTNLLKQLVPMISEGGELYPVLVNLGKAASYIVDQFTKAGDTGDWGGFISNMLANLGKSFVNLTGTFEKWVSGIDWGKVSDDLSEGINKIDWHQLGEDIAKGTQQIASALHAAFRRIKWGEIFMSIVNALGQFMGGAFLDQWTKNLAQLYQITVKQIGIMVNEIEQWWDHLVAVTSGMWQRVLSVISAILGMLGGIIAAAIGGIVAAIMGWVGAIAQALESIKKAFFAAFLGAGQQAIAGLQNIWSQVMNMLTSFMAAAMAIVKSGITIAINIPLPNFGGILQSILAGIAMIERGVASGGGSKATGGGSNNKNKATGTKGWETVPAGFPGDSYTVGLTSGERYAVIPNGGAQNLGQNPVPAGNLSGDTFIFNFPSSMTFAARNEVENFLAPFVQRQVRLAKSRI